MCADSGEGQTYRVAILQDATGSKDLAYLQKGEHCEAMDGSGECGEARVDEASAMKGGRGR